MDRRFVLGAAGLLSAVALALPAGAQAASGTTCQVTGTMFEDDFGAVQSDRQTGSPSGTVEVQQFTHPIELAGGISGVGFDQERAWFQGKTYDFTSHDIVTFDPALSSLDPAVGLTTNDPLPPITDATVSCPGVSRTGTLEVNFLATGNYATNSFVAHFEIVGSGGGLDGTTGSGTMTGEPGVPGGNGVYTATVNLR